MLEKYELASENWVSSIVEQGDDDALFASGYLQGHFAVVLSQLEVEDDQGVDALSEKMQACLVLAREELDDRDYSLVENAWSELSKVIKA